VVVSAAYSSWQTPQRKIAETGINKELVTLDIVLAAKVARSAITLQEYVQLRQAQGATLDIIRADLLTDLEEGGRIFGEFRNAMQPTFAGSINRFRDVGIFGELGTKVEYRWCAVLVNTCVDCLDRHKQVHPLDYWEEEGLPRSGATVCGQNCKCVLLPVDATETEPIYRKGG
jgi:hypothetical protein